MGASIHQPEPRPGKGLQSGELPLWPVLLVAGWVLYLGVLRPVRATDRSGAEGTDVVAAAEPGLRRTAVDGATEAVALEPLLGTGPNARVESVDPRADNRDGEPEHTSGALPVSSSTQSRRGPVHRLEVEGAAGASAETGHFERGLRHGPWEVRWPDGTLRTRGQYEHGLRTGAWEQYAVTGALIELSEFAGGERHGTWQSWGDDGQLLGEGEYESSLRSGPWVLYYSDGRVRERGHYQDGLREGTWEFYDDLGRPTPRAGTYVAGIRID